MKNIIDNNNGNILEILIATKIQSKIQNPLCDHEVLKSLTLKQPLTRLQKLHPPKRELKNPYKDIPFLNQSSSS